MKHYTGKIKLSVTAILLLCSASSGFSQKLSDLTWLAGDWTSKSETQVVNESWSFMNDSTLVGSSVTTKSDSIIFEEALRIEFRNDSIRYIAVLPFKIATFGLSERSEAEYVFIDPTNEFPSRISYRREQSGLQISLEGKNNKEEFNFVKKN